MIPPIYSTLSADAAVSAIIGSGSASRCYPFGFAPQGTQIPYISWQTVSGLPLNKLKRGSFCDFIRAQVDCWSNTADGALSLAEAARSALDAVGVMTSLNLCERDEETRLYRYSMDFEFIIPVTVVVPPPVAEFSGTPLTGNAPLNVTFSDLSSNSPTSWLWSFGDASTSTSQNPSHSFATYGTYTVSLTATNSGGDDTETKSAYVNIAFEELSPPSGFGWTPPYKVLKDGSGYSTDYDPTPFLVEGDPGVTTFYIDGDTGNDANPGTAVSPKKSFYPVTGGRYTKLLLKIRGTFYRVSASYIQYAHDNLCVEAWGGAAAVLTMETDPVAYPWVWTSVGSGTWTAPWPTGTTDLGVNVYAGTVIDSLSRLTPVGSSAACTSTASSYFIDYGGGKVWVHTAGGTSPATGHTLFGNNGYAGLFECSVQAYPQRVMYKGIDFRGGAAAFTVYGDSAYSKMVEFVDCTFKHANDFGATHCTGNATVIFYGCTAGPSCNDGFSATTASGAVGGNVPSVMEINCIGRNNGWIATGANQGSTTHFTGKLVRVNGQYYNNADDQIADVGEDTRSWNLACTLGPKGSGSSKSGAQAGNDATDIRMWFDGCVFTGLDYGWSAASGATIYYKNMTAPSTNPASTGTITTY